MGKLGIVCRIKAMHSDEHSQFYRVAIQDEHVCDTYGTRWSQYAEIPPQFANKQLTVRYKLDVDRSKMQPSCQSLRMTDF